MLVLEDDRQRRPELLRHLGVVPRVGRGLDQDRVIAHGDASRKSVIHRREMPSRLARPGHVVADAEQRAGEVGPVQVDVPLHHGQCLVLVQPAAEAGVPLTPHAERADVDEGDVRVAVVAPGHGREEMIQLLKEDGIEVVGIPERAARARTLAELEVDPLRAGVLHPPRRGVAKPALRAAHPQWRSSCPWRPTAGPACRAATS